METKKVIGLAAAALVLVVSGNIIGSAIYTRTQIDIDWKKIALAGVIGFGAAFVAVKLHKG
jgi:heme/copper-type cytochrome/quinol oxidase subunit 3